MSKDYLDFMTETLIPCANKILRKKFDAYCSGEDIGVETKSDSTPASEADRETEKTLRTLINAKYPDHGILGEEYGAENINRDWVWVLDPLDGTREFLSKKTNCFGTLIGLFYQRKAVTGIISDPMNDKIWSSLSSNQLLKNDISLSKSSVACTNPVGMFKTLETRNSIQAVQDTALEFKTHLNCMGFAGVADGTIDVSVENDLGLHDIAALIPVLTNAGATIIDFQGNDYSTMFFDLSSNKKFGMIAAVNEALAQEVLSIFQQQQETA